LAGCSVTDLVVGYSKKSFDGDTVLDVIALEMPPQSFDTVCLRIDLPELNLDGPLESQIGGGSWNGTRASFTRSVVCRVRSNDLGSAWFAVFHETLCPAIFIYDRTPGGVGLVEVLYKNIRELIDGALDRIRKCECRSGCPGCLYLSQCEIGMNSWIRQWHTACFFS